MYSTSSPLKGKIHSQLFLVVLQSLNRVLLFVSPWTAARQASLSITNSWSLLKLMSIKSMMPSNHLILCHPLLPLPSIFPSIRVFSKQSVDSILCFPRSQLIPACASSSSAFLNMYSAYKLNKQSDNIQP